MYQTYSVLTIDDGKVAAVTRDLDAANTLRVTVGTNCPQGESGRTLLVLERDTSSGITFEASEKSKKVSLVFEGDGECETLIEALEFAAATLRTLQHANGASRPSPAASRTATVDHFA
jgi:hypothetical protein